jgi:biotin operon repressor
MKDTSKAGGGYVAGKVTATDAKLRFSAPTKSASTVVTRTASTGRGQGTARLKAVDTAVYSHIQAMRALGVTTISSDQLARSLALPRSVVDSAVSRMRDRGVKVAR